MGPEEFLRKRKSQASGKGGAKDSFARGKSQKPKAKAEVLDICAKVTAADLDMLIPGWGRHGALMEAKFVWNYMKEGSAEGAAKKTWPQKSQRPGSPEGMLLRPGIQKMIQIASRNLVGAKFNELRMRVVKILWERAFYDPANYYNVDGTPRFGSWDELPDEMRAVVESIETKAYGKDAFTITSMKLADRMSALKELKEIMVAGSMISEGSGDGNLGVDDLKILFDDNARTFEEAERHMLGIDEGAEEGHDASIDPGINGHEGNMDGDVNPDALTPRDRVISHIEGAGDPHSITGTDAGTPRLTANGLASALPSEEMIKNFSNLAKGIDGSKKRKPKPAAEA